MYVCMHVYIYAYVWAYVCMNTSGQATVRHMSTCTGQIVMPSYPDICMYIIVYDPWQFRIKVPPTTMAPKSRTFRSRQQRCRVRGQLHKRGTKHKETCASIVQTNLNNQHKACAVSLRANDSLALYYVGGSTHR